MRYNIVNRPRRQMALFPSVAGGVTLAAYVSFASIYAVSKSYRPLFDE